ncbi:hypothetical protein B6N58_14355 [Legionella micdadei]|uniref:hypothetical protein n=1 Tax=Legionella micdadei TaxID=451 RepID=UPI0009EF7CB3|nr:hypothetical protein [Legionella micdadei]ARG98739.1 hypothetical protein B6N58_14355 [Legionella micdadei]
MHIAKSLFTFFFVVHLLFTSGYSIRWIFQSVSLTTKDKKAYILPNAIESITGYALTALLCLFTLVICKSLLLGGLLSCILSFSLSLSLYRNYSQFHIRKFRFTPAFAIKLAFLGVLLSIYGPCLIGLCTKFHLPEIFDLPKQIAAIIAAAHVHQWPAPNPYFPQLTFAYNLSFYLPLGLIARSLEKAKLFLPIFSCMVLWVAWQTLGLLEMIMEKFGLTHRQRAAGLLMAAFTGA